MSGTLVILGYHIAFRKLLVSSTVLHVHTCSVDDNDVTVVAGEPDIQDLQ